jgi:hypothetical protein
VGINPFWQEDFFLTVQGYHHHAQLLQAEPHFIVNCNDKVFFHLVPLTNNFTPQELISLQSQFKNNGLLLIHLWEDIWLAKRVQVLSRLNSFLGLNKGFHGRKAKIETISQKQAIDFLNDNHLQGYVKAKYYYGLTTNDNLIALASFSATRPMKSKGKDYQSAELVRFASKDGLTIVGGLSKLVKHFIKQIKINDLMTYADRDWSLGSGYNKLGFTQSDITEPMQLYLNKQTLIRYSLHRLPKSLILSFKAQNTLNLDDFLLSNGYIKLFNTGNLKFHLFL